MPRVRSLIVTVSIMLGLGIVVPGVVLQSAKAEAAIQATSPASDPVAAEFFRVT